MRDAAELSTDVQNLSASLSEHDLLRDSGASGRAGDCENCADTLRIAPTRLPTHNSEL